MKRSAFLTVFVCALSFSVWFSIPANAGSYNLNNQKKAGYEWGNTFNLPGDIRDNGGSVEILDASIGFSMDNSLGCGGLDLGASFKGMIDGLNPAAITAQVKDYFTTGLANYLLTQVYSSPALAAIFDSLEAFGNARVSMMQQKCMSHDELKSAGGKLCMKRNPGNPEKCFKDKSPELQSAAADDKKMKEDKANKSGSLYKVLGIDPTDPSESAWSNFIPDFKYCANTEGRCSYTTAANKKPAVSGAEMNTIATTAVMAQLQSLKATVAMVIHSNGIEWVKEQAAELFKIANHETNHDNSLMIANVDERSFINPFISDIILNDISFAAAQDDQIAPGSTGPEQTTNQYPSAKWDEFSKIMPSDVTTPGEREFVLFLNCRSTDFGVETARFINAMVPGAFPAISEIYTGGKAVDDTYAKMIDNISGLSNKDKTFLSGAALIGIATSCVYNHNMHMHPTDFIDLVEMGNTRANGILGAVANQVSGLAVESILRFMKQKILDKKTGGVKSAETSANETEPIGEKALATMGSVIASLENKIQILKSTRQAERSFSSMMGEVHKARAQDRAEQEDFFYNYGE